MLPKACKISVHCGAIAWRHCGAIVEANLVSASMTNSGFVLSGLTAMMVPRMSKSLTIIRKKSWPVHPYTLVKSLPTNWKR
jgi:hypothetical protein